MAAEPGWYRDPADPTREWFWDGAAYVADRAVAAASRPPIGSGLPRWLVSWPAIVAGLVLCLVPGLVLLWLRPTSVRTKAAVTALTVTVAVLVGVLNPSQPVEHVSTSLPAVVQTDEPSGSQPPTAATTPTSTPSDTSAPTASLTPTPSASEAPTGAVATGPVFEFGWSTGSSSVRRSVFGGRINRAAGRRRRRRC